MKTDFIGRFDFDWESVLFKQLQFWKRFLKADLPTLSKTNRENLTYKIANYYWIVMTEFTNLATMDSYIFFG